MDPIPDVEELARAIHEAEVESIAARRPGIDAISWDHLPESEREVRRAMARYLLDRFTIIRS
jgi:hypothetical protein